MRQWLVVLLAAFAILGTSLPALASDPPPEVTLPGFLGIGDDSLPTNGDDDEDEDDANDDDHDGDAEEEADEDEEEDEDGEDDKDEFEEEEREVKVEITEDAVTIELELKSEEREDEVKIQFEAAEAQMKVSFESEQEASEEIETEVEMRVTFREILEFVDENGNGVFNVGEEILQSFLVETLEILDLSQSVIDPEGREVRVLYAFPDTSDGTFELVFSIFGIPREVNGVLVAPTQAKIDIIVRNFPFEATDSRLAIDVEFRTEFELETTEGVEPGTIVAEGEAFAAFFEPLPTATVGGVEETVEVTVIEEHTESETGAEGGEFERRVRLFMAYSQGSEIIHDPIVGIMTVAAVVLPGVPLPSMFAYVVGLGTALLLVLGVWALNRRRP